MDIFKLVGSVFVDTEGADKSLQKTGKHAEDTSSKFSKIVETTGKVAIGLGAMGTAAATALWGVTTKSAETADNIDKLSQRLGLTREGFQELDFVLSQSGVDINSFQTGMKSLLKNMDAMNEGNKTATENFSKLGVEVANADGSLRNEEDVLWDTIAAFQQMEDSTDKSRLAQELFGKQGQEIIPLLNGAAGSMEEMRQQAHELGLVLSDEAIDSGVVFTDTMDQVQRSLSAIMTNIGASVMPVIQSVLDWVIAHMPEIQAFLQATFDVFNTIVDGIVTAVGWVFDNFGEYFPMIQEVVGEVFDNIAIFWEEHLKPMFDALMGFIQNVLVPVFRLVFEHYIKPIVEACFKGIIDLWNGTLKPILESITDFIANVFEGDFVGAFQNIKDMVGEIFDGMITVIKIPLNAIIGIVNSFIGKINGLKIPDWVPVVGGKSPNIPTIPLLAKGGDIIGGGSAIVGEAGAELIDLPTGAKVTPLTRSGGGGSVEDLMRDMVSLLSNMDAMMYSAVSQALKDGVDIDFDDRNLARLIQKYA